MSAYASLRGPYGQYLQQRSFTRDITQAIGTASRSITLEVSRQGRESIASIDALTREQIRVARTDRDLKEHLLWDLEGVRDDLQRLNATFQWGFSSLIAQVGSLGQSLAELARIAQTPNRTRAYEYYNDSREAYSREHFAEAHSAIEKAVGGDGESTTGYRLDWRFHHLKALVHLGGPGDNHRYLDLASAAESATKAVEYAISAGDHVGSSVAALTTSWAAYCSADFQLALQWARRAVAFDGDNPEAHFQTAKVLMALGSPDDGIPSLLGAVRLDRRYVLRALDDGDFLVHESRVRAAFDGHRAQLAEATTRALVDSLADAAFWTAILDPKHERTSDWLAVADVLLADASRVPLLDLIQLSQWRQRRATAVTHGRTWDLDLLARVAASSANLAAVSHVLVDDVATKWDGRLSDQQHVIPALERIAKVGNDTMVRALAIRHAASSESVAVHAFVFEARRRLAETREEWRSILRSKDVDTRSWLLSNFMSLRDSTYVSIETREDLRRALADWYRPLIPKIEALISEAGTEAAAARKRDRGAIFWWLAAAVLFTMPLITLLTDRNQRPDGSMIFAFLIVGGLWFGFVRAVDAGKTDARESARRKAQLREAQGWADVLERDLYDVPGSYKSAGMA
jgi:hypothetical protein